MLNKGQETNRPSPPQKKINGYYSLMVGGGGGGLYKKKSTRYVRITYLLLPFAEWSLFCYAIDQNSLSVCLSGCSSVCLSAWSSVITFRNLTFFAVCGSLSAELVLSTYEHLASVSFLSYVQISLTLRHNYKLL